MKKIALLFVFAVAMATAAFAQPRAVGVRIGYGAGASYQHSMGENNMIEVEVALPAFNAIEAAATYDWINPGGLVFPEVGKGKFNWYAGVGAGVGYDWGRWWYSAYAFGGVAGRIGVEYNFEFPLQLSVDWRPLIGVEGNKYGVGFYADGLYSGAIAVGARYTF